MLNSFTVLNIKIIMLIYTTCSWFCMFVRPSVCLSHCFLFKPTESWIVIMKQSNSLRRRFLKFTEEQFSDLLSAANKFTCDRCITVSGIYSKVATARLYRLCEMYRNKYFPSLCCPVTPKALQTSNPRKDVPYLPFS